MLNIAQVCLAKDYESKDQYIPYSGRNRTVKGIHQDGLRFHLLSTRNRGNRVEGSGHGIQSLEHRTQIL